MMSTVPYRNPVIPGFHPDPSVCRVGADYYLVTSSFEYFPGVPVFHSRDLVHWRPIGYCLTRDSQLPLQNAKCSAGIWAPTLRHHGGLFYMVTTNMSGFGNFYVTAADPAGPWSEPVPIDYGGIDPTLFFDDDGTTYFITGGQKLSVIDLAAGRRLSPVEVVWPGSGGSYPEGPHLYKVNGLYYLLIAEGGTGRGHQVTVARSPSPRGPYEACPRNPILTHAHLAASPVQCTGHGDLVQAHDGSWWMVFLGTRPVAGGGWHLGRETFLAPVTWDEQGWPVVNGGRPITPEMDAPALPSHPWPAEPERDDFLSPALALCWNHRRNPVPGQYSLSERPGWLRLRGSTATLEDNAPVAFVGRRQQHLKCEAEVRMEFEPGRYGEEAGLTVLMNGAHHYDLGVTRRDGARAVFARRRLGSLAAVTASRPLRPGAVELSIVADPDRYTLRCRQDGGDWVDLDAPETRYIAPEVAGSYTGAYFGLYATGNGAPGVAPADFDWFDYRSR